MASRSSFRPSNPALNNGPLATAFAGNGSSTAYAPPRSSSGPVWPSDDVVDQRPVLDDRMTLNGTILKTGTLLGLLTMSAMIPWFVLGAGTPDADLSGYLPFLLVGGIGGLILAMVTIFKPNLAPYTAPAYAVAEGLFVGAISAVYATAYEGIVSQAALLTIGVAGGMLFLYSNRIIRVTDKLRKGIVAATIGIMAVYALSFVMRLFGAQMPFLHDTGPLGIMISLFIVGVAAFNLLLDFDLIERGVKNGAPKVTEWYGAFALVVTLVWLYLELLRLLSKLRSD